MRHLREAKQFVKDWDMRINVVAQTDAINNVDQSRKVSPFTSTESTIIYHNEFAERYTFNIFSAQTVDNSLLSEQIN